MTKANQKQPDTASKRYRLGCDIGGTFTDFVLFDQHTGETFVEKCLSTPSDPELGVLTGVRQLAERCPGFLAQTEDVLHATTLVINAVIERKGARTALLTTSGFRDIIEIGREMRYDIYDVFLAFPKPLVPRYWRRGVTERTYYDGSIGAPLDPADLARTVESLRNEQIESIAVCFLHSYANPENERAARALLRDLAPRIPVSLSSEVLPEVREYERTTTTVVNAYAKPLVARYIARLREGLSSLGFKKRLLIMLSSGGMTTTDTAAEFPVRIIESGPAAGSIAAATVGGVAGYKDILAFDMGGTTAKGCIIRSGAVQRTCTSEIAREHRFKRGSGIPVSVPFVDLVEIGAGGGSIAHIDSLGLLQVGPESAGASPGPACYGLGGKNATVSDANLVLGYLNPEYFLGGKMRLDESAARRAIEALAKRLDLTTERLAAGILQLVTENMAVAIRIHMADRGVDPGRFALFAFGGAGPIHACALAKRLGISTVLVPPVAGIASAFGLLVSPMSFDQVRTYRCPLPEVDFAKLEELFAHMEQEALKSFGRLDRSAPTMTHRSLDLCYAGQNETVNVGLEQNAPLDATTIRQRFEEAYRTLYSRSYSDMRVQLVNARITVETSNGAVRLKKFVVEDTAEAAPRSKRLAYSGLHDGYIEHAVYDRYALAPGARVRGPAIIEECESTTVLDADASAVVDAHKVLVVTIEAGRHASRH